MKYLKLNFMFLPILLVLSSCTAFRELKEDNARRKVILKNQSKIEVGMSKDDVVRILGTPCNIQFDGENEALQYCYTTAYDEKLYMSHYVVIWLSNAAVTGLTTYNDTSSDFCINSFQSVYWENSHGYLLERRRWR
ncbi:MAG: hypothetical protein QM800_14175 [Paludibacter sp.]